MTGTESRTLQAGARVVWNADIKDAGTVIRMDWSSVTIKWDGRIEQSILHNDMVGVSVF